MGMLDVELLSATLEFDIQARGSDNLSTTLRLPNIVSIDDMKN